MYEDRGFNWMPTGLVIGMAVGLSLFLIYKPEPKSPPNNDAAFGCYIADKAPVIRLDETGMHIPQDRIATIGYHLEIQKTGIVLAAERPIEAQLVVSAYRFSIADKGEGRFLRFLRDGGDTRYCVFDNRGLQSFEMIANDGYYLLYRKAEPDICDEIAER